MQVCVKHCSDDARVETTAAEKDIQCVLSEEFLEIGINTCLILQNMIDVTVTAVQYNREHPNRVKGSVETVGPNYYLPRISGEG